MDRGQESKGEPRGWKQRGFKVLGWECRGGGGSESTDDRVLGVCVVVRL